jgi:hypothetical protein
MDESRGGSWIVYPKLFATLTEADLDTGNSPVLHCEATFTGRGPRTFQSTRARRIGKTVPFALTWVLRRGVQAPQPSLRRLSTSTFSVIYFSINVVEEWSCTYKSHLRR